MTVESSLFACKGDLIDCRIRHLLASNRWTVCRTSVNTEPAGCWELSIQHLLMNGTSYGCLWRNQWFP